MSGTTIEINGHEFRTGCLERVLPQGGLRNVGWYGDNVEKCPVLPRAQWKNQESLAWAERVDIDQGNLGACCICSLGNAIVFHLAVSGRPVPDLDWKRLYKLLSPNDSGVALDAAHEYVATKGFPIVGSTGVVLVTESYECPDVESYLSGIQIGMRGIAGRFIGRGGHAEAHLTVQIPGSVNTVKTRVRGTWGKSYGEQGWYDVDEADLKRGIPYFGAFLIAEVAIRPADQIPDVKP